MSPAIHAPLDFATERYVAFEAEAMTLRVHAATVGDVGTFYAARLRLLRKQRELRQVFGHDPSWRFPLAPHI